MPGDQGVLFFVQLPGGFWSGLKFPRELTEVPSRENDSTILVDHFSIESTRCARHPANRFRDLWFRACKSCDTILLAGTLLGIHEVDYGHFVLDAVPFWSTLRT